MPYFTGSRGRVHHDAWLPDGDVRSVIVFLHGFAEHIGLYDVMGRRLAAAGHAVHAFDEVGHGRSDGKRAVIESWDHLVDDALMLVRLVRRQHPGMPLILMGHSHGALAATLLAIRNPGLASALVLSGAAVRPLAWVAEEIAGEAETPDDLDPTTLLSRHPDYVHALLHDPLVYQGGFPREYLLAMTRTWPEVADALADGRPTLPTLLVHGEDDPLVPLSVPREVATLLPDATLRVFAGDLHDVLNEHDRDQVHDTVAAWLAETLLESPTSRPTSNVGG